MWLKSYYGHKDGVNWINLDSAAGLDIQLYADTWHRKDGDFEFFQSIFVLTDRLEWKERIDEYRKRNYMNFGGILPDQDRTEIFRVLGGSSDEDTDTQIKHNDWAYEQCAKLLSVIMSRMQRGFKVCDIDELVKEYGIKEEISAEDYEKYIGKQLEVQDDVAEDSIQVNSEF